MGREILAATDAIRARKPGIAIDRIIVHTMEGSLAGTIAWFKSPDLLSCLVRTESAVREQQVSDNCRPRGLGERSCAVILRGCRS